MSDGFLITFRRKTPFCPVLWKWSKQIAYLSATIQDTVVWDPSTCPWPSSCSTPNQPAWAGVVVHCHKGHLDGTASAPHISLSNCYALLSDDTVVHQAEASATPTIPDVDQ